MVKTTEVTCSGMAVVGRAVGPGATAAASEEVAAKVTILGTSRSHRRLPRVCHITGRTHDTVDAEGEPPGLGG